MADAHIIVNKNTSYTQNQLKWNEIDRKTNKKRTKRERWREEYEKKIWMQARNEMMANIFISIRHESTHAAIHYHIEQKPKLSDKIR